MPVVVMWTSFVLALVVISRQQLLSGRSQKVRFDLLCGFREVQWGRGGSFKGPWKPLGFFLRILHFHESNQSEATMAIKKYELQNPYGVVNTKGLEIISFEEKPIQISYVNAGIYALNPSSLKYLLVNEHCDMPDFFKKLRHEKHLITAYPIHEPWADVGRPIDLSEVNESEVGK